MTQAAAGGPPDFIIIGAQKSATTSLLSYMGQHPRIRLPRKKAMHFFDLNYRRGADWYVRQFPRPGGVAGLLNPFARERRRDWITGESCPSYMFLPEVPERVRAVVPAVKIIVSLRDPVERLVSQYHHERRKGRTPGSFADYVAPSLGMAWPPAGEVEQVRRYCAVPRGFYADQLRHWLAFFPHENFHLIRFDRLIAEPEATLTGIFAFLGLPTHRIDTSEVLNRGTRGGDRDDDADLMARLRNLYRDRNRDLPSLFGEDFRW